MCEEVLLYIVLVRLINFEFPRIFKELKKSFQKMMHKIFADFSTF